MVEHVKTVNMLCLVVRYVPTTAGVEINFFGNLPGQVMSNVYLLEEISACAKKIGAISSEVV